jgi:hypothetical protein
MANLYPDIGHPALVVLELDLLSGELTHLNRNKARNRLVIKKINILS